MTKAQNDALAAWRGDTLGLTLEAEDLELIDNVLCVIPELRAVAFLGREARRRGLTYPVSDVDQLVALLDADTIVLGGHRIDAETVRNAVPDEWFPLNHEGELLSATLLGLRRCEAEHAARLLDHHRSYDREAPEPSGPPVEEDPKR